MSRLIVIALLFASLSTSANAQDDSTPFLTGNGFVRLCDTKSWKMACLSYVLGVFHGSQTGPARTICLPDGVDNEQMYEVAVAYIRATPAKRHHVAFDLLLESWQTVFPCR